MLDVQLIKENWDYYNGGHFQFWIGVKPSTDTEEGRLIQEEIERMFQEVNMVAEVTNRHADALLGKDPAAYFSRGESEIGEPELDAANTQLTQLLEDILGNPLGDSEFPDALYESVVSLLVGGVAYLRATTVEGKAYLHCPPIESVNVLERNAVGSIVKIEYFYTEGEERRKEIQYFDDKKLTVFEYYRKKVDSDEYEESPYETFKLNLNGQLTITEARRRPLITKSMKTAQNALNHAATLIPRNNHVSGFISRIFLNAKVPGEFVVNQLGDRVFQPDPDAIVYAPGMLNFVSGIPLRDAEGNVTGLTSPTVHTEQPIDVTSFIESARFSVGTIYSQANQAHLLANDLLLSGRARVELRNDFVISLQKDARRLQDFWAKAFKNVFYLTQYALGNDPKSWFAALFHVRVNATPGLLAAEERQILISTHAAGLASKRTVISLLGYADSVEAELEAISNEQPTN
jgi:hypothetical protein